MPFDKTDYYLFNYEQMDQAIKLSQELNLRGKKYFIIVDETHNFADPKSNRTQKLVKLQTLVDPTYFVWTTGTPILKSAAELVSYLRCADPRFDRDAELRFRRIYQSSPGRAGEIFNHRMGLMMSFTVPKSRFIEGKPTVKELPVRLPPHIANRFLMSTVRSEMKEFIKERLDFYSGSMKEYRAIVDKWLLYHERKLETRAQKKAFDKYKTDIKVLSKNPDLMLTEIMASAKSYERSQLLPSLPPHERRAFRNALSTVKSLKLKVRGEALGQIIGKRRAECAEALGLYCKPEEIIKDSLSKTLFFSSAVQPILSLGKYLDDQGINSIRVYAGTNNQLSKMMHDFDTDPNIDACLATMKSLSEAVPVTSASTVCFLNRPFRDAQSQQTISRAFRLGQKFPVTVINVTLDTGDEPNVSSTTDDILRIVRDEISVLIGPEFIAYNDGETELLPIIDHAPVSQEFDIVDI
jgi:hypothetical protein